MNIIQPILITLVLGALAIYFLVSWYIRRRIKQLSGDRRGRRARTGNGTPIFTIALVVTLLVSAFFLLIVLFLFA